MSEIVQPERRVRRSCPWGRAGVSQHLGPFTLLPIHPPDVDAFAHGCMQSMLEESVHPCFVQEVHWYVLLGLGINASILCQHWIRVLSRLHTASQVEVDRIRDPLRSTPVEQLGMLREVILIPGVASPSLLLTSLVLLHFPPSIPIKGRVPVHVQHQHIQGDTPVLILLHNIPHLQVAVPEPPGVPQPEGELGEHGNGTRQLDVILQRLLEIQPVSEQVPIHLGDGFVGFSRHGPQRPFGVGGVRPHPGPRVVHQRPAIATNHAHSAVQILTL
mmetsp:Transcript_40633/g.97372  ORF Transcript_40633/g.97372 Transcript_40633/m.97372 type:complete len:273 (-) Transcript_40633:467-1285(-)